MCGGVGNGKLRLCKKLVYQKNKAGSKVEGSRSFLEGKVCQIHEGPAGEPNLLPMENWASLEVQRNRDDTFA